MRSSSAGSMVSDFKPRRWTASLQPVRSSQQISPVALRKTSGQRWTRSSNDCKPMEEGASSSNDPRTKVDTSPTDSRCGCHSSARSKAPPARTATRTSDSTPTSTSEVWKSGKGTFGVIATAGHRGRSPNGHSRRWMERTLSEKRSRSFVDQRLVTRGRHSPEGPRIHRSAA